MNIGKFLLTLFLSLMVMNTTINADNNVPSHPSNLSFDTLDWKIPLGEAYRTVINDNLRLYISSDSSLPLIQVTGYARYGTLADPEGKEGISQLLGTLMRTGGTEEYSADSLDALIDLLAMNFAFSVNEGHITINASFLSEYKDTGMNVLKQILFHPVFDKKKLEKERQILMQSVRHRFDDPGPTVAAAYKRAMYPNAAGRMSTETSLKSINRKDLIKLHKNVFIPNNMIVAVSGRFDRKAMIKDLETIFPSSSQKAHESIFPKVSVTPVAKSLIVHKPITQSYVRIGLPLVQRPHPDYYPLSMLNTILGGSGFTSRLGTKIRSDEGLTYSIYSHSESNYLYPGTFFISFFTKTETFAKATALTLAEFEKIRKGGVTKEELTHAKKSLVGELPSMFRSPHDVVATYAWNELYGRSQDHYEVYPNKVEALTQEDILEVAKKYLDPEKLTYVVVADTATLKKMGGYKSFEFSDIKPQRTIQPNDIPSLSNKEKREKK